MKRYRYRSKFERTTAEYLKARKVSFTYESMELEYSLVHKYKPDFVLKNGIIIETKGRFTSRDRTKMKQVKYYNPKLDIRFCFMRDNYLYKGSTTKYSDWCRINGFQYCIKEIPEKWLK